MSEITGGLRALGLISSVSKPVCPLSPLRLQNVFVGVEQLFELFDILDSLLQFFPELLIIRFPFRYILSGNLLQLDFFLLEAPFHSGNFFFD